MRVILGLNLFENLFPMMKIMYKPKILALNWWILLTYFILFQFLRQGWSNIANKYNFDNLGKYQKCLVDSNYQILR